MTLESRELVRTIRCECGATMQAAGDVELLALAECHMAAEHPQLVQGMTRDALLALATDEESGTPARGYRASPLSAVLAVLALLVLVALPAAALAAPPGFMLVFK